MDSPWKQCMFSVLITNITEAIKKNPTYYWLLKYIFLLIQLQSSYISLPTVEWTYQTLQSLGHCCGKPPFSCKLWDQEDILWSVHLVGPVSTTYKHTHTSYIKLGHLLKFYIRIVQKLRKCLKNPFRFYLIMVHFWWYIIYTRFVRAYRIKSPLKDLFPEEY